MLQFLEQEFILFLFTTVHDTNIISLIHKHWFKRQVYGTLNTGSYEYVCNATCAFSNISSALVSPQVKKSHSDSHVPDLSDTRYTHMCLFA